MLLSFPSALLLSLLAAPALASTPVAGDILAVVPEGCHEFVYCEDFAGLRSRAERNDWIQLLRSDDGSAFLGGFEEMYRHETRLELSELFPIAKTLRGESVFFFLPGVACFFTEAPGSREDVREALKSWLPDPGPAGVRKEMEIATAHVELVSWPESGDSAWSGRLGHYVAFVEHEKALGLLSADSIELLVAALESTLARLSGETRSSIVEAYAQARATQARSGGLEFYVDFSAYAEAGERMLKDSLDESLPDPQGMLGLESNTWLIASLDFQPGRRIDCNGFLNVPKDTLASRLADTFKPLPPTLVDRLPSGLSGLWALQWDLNSFYRIAREAFVKRHGEDCFEIVDGGLEAAKGMTGVDPLTELVANMDGTFAFYFAHTTQSADVRDVGLMNFGMLLGLSKGAAFMQACERLIDSTMGDYLELDEIEGADVYRWNEELVRELEDEEGQSLPPGGIAFLPDNFVLCVFGEVLQRQMNALTQKPLASLANQASFAGSLADRSGATFFACIELNWLREMFMTGGGRGPADQAALSMPAKFQEALLVSSVRRTASGFELKLEVR